MPRKCKLQTCKAPIPSFAKSETLHEKKGFCSFDHMVEWGAAEGKRKAEIKRRKESAAEKRRIREEKRAHNAKTREMKAKLKTRSDLMKEAQMAFNGYIRVRDFGLPCASCGALPDNKFGGTVDCSHWRSVGSAPHLRFNMFNAAAACVKCNRYLSGNPVELEKGLVAKFGPEIVERVKYDQSSRRYDKDYLRRIKKIFTKKTRMRKKRYNID